MKPLILACLGALFCASSLSAQTTVTTLENYNKQLPYWGVSWAPGQGAVNGYYPTFYTGFAIRSESPDRIHVRLARGNQTRVSVILDEQAVSDYLFDLVKRYNFYKKMISRGAINIKPTGGQMIPQVSYFSQIIESPVYGILPFVEQAQAGRETAQTIYAKGLKVLSDLNPGRVFLLQIDLKAEFLKWKNEANTINMSSESGVLVALNSLLWGRVNATAKPTPELLQKLAQARQLALQGSEAEFIAAALDLFKAATGDKYQIKVLNAQGRFEDAIQCKAASCTLSYPEFTTIYPTGSVMASTTDKFGNRINTFTTPGLWQFIERSGGRGVDNIRTEPYYGWAPKMDYQDSGNGFHNPAVRFAGISAAVKSSLGIPNSHNTLWAVKRGGVSHGCSRLALGHVWEMRHIFPVEGKKMSQILHFGNHPQDFDVYDIDGDGRPEVMGVEYMISYNLQGTSGLGRREGADLEVSNDRKIDFYRSLYGAQSVFNVGRDGKLVFKDPGVSLPSYLDFRKTGVKTRMTVSGQIPLYEQSYEKDKVQFYSAGSGINKGLIRLMGRVRGCAPSSNKADCGEAAFDKEAQSYIRGE